MDTLIDSFLASLERGHPEAALLARAGDDDPTVAAAEFAAAAAHPDLEVHTQIWVPALLRSARPGYGARTLAELAAKRRETGPPLDLPTTPQLPSILGNSNFLARRLLNEPGWVDELAGDVPAAPAHEPSPDWSEIRRTKYRGLLRIAARDLGDRPFAASLRELSDLADRCLRAGLRCASLETGLPEPALFALGKLGGRELNFSSDVDLLFIYRRDPAIDVMEENQRFGAVIRRFKTGLETPSRDGFGYRVDLDLRPEGPTGVLVNSVEAALAYYESFGAEWERQMLIRLRAVAGPDDAAAAFAEGIAPFVYRRLIDPRVMHDVHAMKERIEDERSRDGRDLNLELKEGPGGIRDVEFLAQSLQLFFGGRDPTLRSGNVLDTLAALEDLRHLPADVTQALSDAYLWLRRAEHAVQLAEEQQTARFPSEPAAQTALARRMGYADAEASEARERMLEDWTAVRNETRAHFDALVLRGGS